MHHRICALAAAIVASLLGSTAGALAQATFSNVTATAGITHLYHPPPVAGEAYFGGAVAEDFDNDGWIDLYVVQGDGYTNHMYMNNGDGTFTDEAGARSADLVTNAVAASAADYDSDGDIDICVSVAFGHSVVLVNDGGGTFTNRISLPLPTNMTMSSSWGDVDNDGLLELAIGQRDGAEQSLYVYKNVGGGVLSNYEFRVSPATDIQVFSPRFADLDDDRLVDLAVVADGKNSQLYMNAGGGMFDNTTGSSGFGGPTGGSNEMGFAIGDYDNDRDLDLFATGIYDLHVGGSNDGNRLYRNNGDGTFVIVTTNAGVENGNWGAGATFGDFDNDGDLDIFHVNGWENDTNFLDRPARLFENNGDGTFTNVAAAADADDLGQGRGVLHFDYDNDGDLDIFIANNRDLSLVDTNFVADPGTPVLLRNDTTNGNHWLNVTVDGNLPYHSDGVGCWIEVRTGSVWRVRELNASTHFMAQGPSRIAHFGMGGQTSANRVRTIWSTGDATSINNVGADQTLLVPPLAGAVSNRTPIINELFTAYVVGEGNPVDWKIGPTTYTTATINISFPTTGIKELLLLVYNPAKTFVTRRESIYVTVQPPPPTPTTLAFTNVTTNAGITHRYYRPDVLGKPHFGGAVAEDFDNDGWIDLYVVQGDGHTNHLYMNNGDGTFTDEAAARSADLAVEGVAASAADYDNDGDIDICVSVVYSNSLILVNDGAGTFTNQIALPFPTNMTMSSSWGDVDNDGQLELAIGQWDGAEQSLYLYKNLGGGVLSNYQFRTAPFTDIRVFAPRFVDLDNDGLSDLVSVADFRNSQMYRNLGDGMFSNITTEAGFGGLIGGTNDMGFAVGDYDEDGDMDLFITSVHNLNYGGGKDGNRLFRNDGNLTFSNVTTAAGVADGNWGWAAAFGDLDLDGDLDIFHVNGYVSSSNFNDQPARLFENNRDGTFTETAATAGADDTGQGRGTLMFDYDNDGDLDIFIANNEDRIIVGTNITDDPGTPVLLRNDTLTSNHWLKVSVDANAPFHNDGIGASVRIKTGSVAGVVWQLRDFHASTHFLAQGPNRIAHFGLGDQTTVTRISVLWPNGDETLINNTAADQHVVVPGLVGDVSNRTVYVGADVDAFVTGETNPVYWVVGTNTFTNSPITVTFPTPGTKLLLLEVYDPTESFITRRERIYVEIIPVPLPTIMQFTNVTTNAGITHRYYRPNVLGKPHFGGAVAEDFNNDGWIDLYVVQGDGHTNHLYMNNGDGTFTDEAAARSADLAVEGVAASAADYDNDGDVDICVSVVYTNSLVLVNDGAGTFTNKIPLPFPTNMTMSSSWGDVDNDGQLELAIGQWDGAEQSLYLYKNLGGGVLSNYQFRTQPFTDIRVFAPRFVDLDGDRLVDLVTAADFSNSQMYRNLGGGMFTNITAEAGFGGLIGGTNDMGFAVGDYDEDGDMDLFITSVHNLNYGGGKDGNRLFRNEGNLTFSNVTTAAGVADGNWGWAAAFGDLDLDGDLDIFHVNGYVSSTNFNDQPARLFMNNRDGTFAEVAASAGADDTGQGRGTLMFDYDNDGDLDIYIANNEDRIIVGTNITDDPGTPVLLRNDTATTNHWLSVELDGRAPYHNDGFGSWVYVKTGSVAGATWQIRDVHASTHFLAQGPGRIAHFGLGPETVVTRTRVVWHNGDETLINNAAADQALLIRSPAGTVSTRTVALGEPLTAYLVDETNVVEWIVGTNVYSNATANLSWTTSGQKVIQVNVFSGPVVIRRERILVNVGPEFLLTPLPTGVLGEWQLEWPGETNGEYQLQETGEMMSGGVWTNTGSVLTNLVDGPISVIVTNDGPRGFYRVIRVDSP